MKLRKVETEKKGMENEEEKKKERKKRSNR
jgi:hypothetical protein